MSYTLVVLGAGLSTRYGRPKQLVGVGPEGDALVDYAAHDAYLAGFDRLVFVIRREQESAFRDHASRTYARALDVEFAFQELWELPGSYRPPPGRRKPWGTGHAVLSTRDLVSRPFAVCNADDYYGASAFEALADHFRDTSSRGDPSHAMVGYRLSETLSPTGGVSRGICRRDDDGFLREIVEVRGIRDTDGLAGVSTSGDPYMLTGDELASMNLWGFRPKLFEALEQQFEDWLDVSGRSTEAEFLLSDAVGELLAFRRIRVRVLPSRDRWVGLTYAADRERVEKHLNVLVAEGRYPVDLAAWFRNPR